MLDGALEFAYSEQQGALLHNELVHHPLASFLDFYANIIIGYDFDTYRKLSGTPYFEKALRIKRLAQERGPFLRGWQFGDNGGLNRAVMIDEILDARFIRLREILYESSVEFYHKGCPHQPCKCNGYCSCYALVDVAARFVSSAGSCT
jgi:hypothetical protein